MLKRYELLKIGFIEEMKTTGGIKSCPLSSAKGAMAPLDLHTLSLKPPEFQKFFHF